MADKEEFDSSIMDVDEDIDSDVKKINPLVYIHHAILSSQKILMVSVMKPGGIKEGILGYKIFIEHIEVVCRSGNFLDKEEYQKKLMLFLDSKEMKEEGDTLVKMAKISNMKLELLLEEVFKRAPTNDTLKI
jgi:hypothetical protein